MQCKHQHQPWRKEENWIGLGWATSTTLSMTISLDDASGTLPLTLTTARTVLWPGWAPWDNPYTALCAAVESDKPIWELIPSSGAYLCCVTFLFCPRNPSTPAGCGGSTQLCHACGGCFFTAGNGLESSRVESGPRTFGMLVGSGCFGRSGQWFNGWSSLQLIPNLNLTYSLSPPTCDCSGAIEFVVVVRSLSIGVWDSFNIISVSSVSVELYGNQ